MNRTTKAKSATARRSTTTGRSTAVRRAGRRTTITVSALPARVGYKPVIRVRTTATIPELLGRIDRTA